MQTDIIIGIIMLGIFTLFLSRVKLARIILLETIRHPFRKAIIRIDPGDEGARKPREIENPTNKDAHQRATV